MTLRFASDYDLALFIVRCLILPVIIGCAFAPLLLRAWKGVDRSFSLAYQFAVSTTIISLVFYIAYTARGASAPNTIGTSQSAYGAYVRPLLAFNVAVAALDLIARIATFILVTQLAITLAAGRRTLLQLLRIVTVALLALLFVLIIAFRGRFADLALHSANVTVGAFNSNIWNVRSVDVAVAFFTVYLVGVLVALVAAISLPSGPLRAALFQLLLISILALASAAGIVSYYNNTLARNYRYDYNTFYTYYQIEMILEVFLQAGILVSLLFATAPPKQIQTQKQVTTV